MNPVAERTYRFSPLNWAVLLITLSLVAVGYLDSLRHMVTNWERPEYSHGYLIPFIVLFLIWQKSDVIERLPFAGSWSGIALVAGGLMLLFMGTLSTIFTLSQYGFALAIMGIALAWLGPKPFRLLAVPLVLLIFMVPLPNFLYFNLSQKLQLLSSAIGVEVIRQFGISVFLEGNVIDLGTFKLQVVEACNGLRYLFPLMTLGFIVTCFYRAPFWQRAFVFLSTIPITVLMNSFRIGMIGVLVEHFGQSMAEGFLHDFEGWVIFMACFAVLFAEMWLLARVTGDRRPLREVVVLDLPGPARRDVPGEARRVPIQAWVALMLLLAAVVPVVALPERTEIVPERIEFAEFPESLGEWQGARDRLEQVYIDELKFDDYVVINFSRNGGKPINFYSAYYASQRSGQSAHSPRTCLPGGGWVLGEFGQRIISDVRINGRPLRVNRSVITQGDSRQLVYYWFQQRGRVITNEYLVKWFLFWDALTRNRTDGALVRLIVPLAPGEEVSNGDAALTDFAARLAPELVKYVPD